MKLGRPRRDGVLAVVGVFCATAFGVATASGDGAVMSASGGKSKRKCSSFASQAAAQDYFFKHSRPPRRKLRSLDPDGNGVACERLIGPYKGVVMAAYNKSGRFFYGSASTPLGPRGGKKYPCVLLRETKGVLGPSMPVPRQVALYRAGRGRTQPFVGPKGSEPNTSAGTMIWKLELPKAARGRFYVKVEAVSTEKGEEPSNCRAFRSRTITVR